MAFGAGDAEVAGQRCGFLALDCQYNEIWKREHLLEMRERAHVSFVQAADETTPLFGGFGFDCHDASPSFEMVGSCLMGG